VDMNDPRIVRLVLTVALPAVAGLAANAGHHAVNALFLGALGPEVLGGVGLVMPLFLLVGATGQGLGIGLATLLARRLGEGDRAGAASVAMTALAATVPLGVALSVPIYLGLPAFAGALGAGEALLAPGLDYGRLLAVGLTLGLLQVVCDFIAIAEGNSRFSMIVLIASFACSTRSSSSPSASGPPVQPSPLCFRLRRRSAAMRSISCADGARWTFLTGTSAGPCWGRSGKSACPPPPRRW